MRESLYRGKRLEDDKWQCGCLLVYGNRCFIIPIEELIESEVESRFYWHLLEKHYEVDPETVGECTGETDKDGKNIFEDDIIRVEFKSEYVGLKPRPSYIGTVKYEQGAFGIYEKGKGTQFFFQHGLIKTVVGNIHDNPALLEG